MSKLSRCTFQLPVAYNDGRPIEPEVIIDIKRALDRQFGGVTFRGVVQGSWLGQEEESLTVEVSVLPSEVPALREVVFSIGQRLGQKAMYFDAPEPSVEIIGIPGPETDAAPETEEEKPEEGTSDV